MQRQGRNLSEGVRGEDVALLHSELAQLRDAGLLDAGIAPDEVGRRFLGPATREAVAAFQGQHGLDATGEVDEATAQRINEEVDALQPFKVEGRVVSRSRPGVGGLRVEIVDRNVGGDDVRLAEVATDGRGAYRALFTIAAPGRRGKRLPDLQARVFTGETFLGASDVRYNASRRETLNVLLTGQADAALATEHETLIANLAAHARGNLRDLQETEERHDITYLANKTGWDARAVALAALADRLSARSTDGDGSPGIEPAFFYALLRAGLPADEQALYRTDPETAADALTQAIAQGVIPAALEEQIPRAVEQFQRRAVQHALDSPAPAGVSPLSEMLSISLDGDPERQRQFAELYVQHRGDSPRLWEAVREVFGEEVERRLRVDGQLGYLTLNNAPLMRRLHSACGDRGRGRVAGRCERVHANRS